MTTQPVQGTIRQIGYVVKDFDAALASWVKAGVGPWFVQRNATVVADYRGAPCEVPVTIGLANSGAMQIEIIHQEDDSPSIYTEFLASGREGYEQLAWWTEDFDAAVQWALDAGGQVVWSGGHDIGVRFAYIEPADGPAAILEICKFSPELTGMMTMIARQPQTGMAPTRSARWAEHLAPCRVGSEHRQSRR